MLAAIVAASVRWKKVVVALLLALFVAGGVGAAKLPIDALPDISPVQVVVITQASGFAAAEMERTVTVPLENALNGVPGATELRSVSREGLSVLTLVFRDGTDPWRARQLVGERLRTVERDLPPVAGAPELAPISTGLGDVFHFALRSEQHSPMQLRTILDWEITPRLRGVPGVVEVNTMGGELKQYRVAVDRAKLRAAGLGLGEVATALRAANVNVGGGYVDRGAESFTLRGQGLLGSAEDIGDVVLRADANGPPVLVRNVADVEVGAALRYGAVTRDGRGEAVVGVVMMLLGENSRDVVRRVGERVAEIRKDLPPGVSIDVTYDRAEFVGETLRTVVKNLVEGVVIVTVVLALFLGSVRAAVGVVLGIPAAMSIAVLGMHLFGTTGDLMSLGAIDFGFLVDGPIVLAEVMMARTVGRRLAGAAKDEAFARIGGEVVRPVAFAVAIITLVYVPLLALEGVEGKMFRPMALTMATALFGALVYSVVFFPAIAAIVVAPPTDHGPRWVQALASAYDRVAPLALRHRATLLAVATTLLVGATALLARSGADFLPRIFEGDAVIAIRRAPSISLAEARDLDLRVERVLGTFPEVEGTVGWLGRAEVAFDPQGNDSTDVYARLAPVEKWHARDFDDLSVRMKDRIESEVPGTFVSVSQPIENKTNDMISGSRADVVVKVAGDDLDDLARTALRIGDVLATIPGTGDLRVERPMGAPVVSAVADRARLARYGVRLEDAFLTIRAAREGIAVGTIHEGERRFELRVTQAAAGTGAADLEDLFVETPRGSVPLGEVVTIVEGDGPSMIRRQDRERTVRVEVNLRGRDLVSWVAEARQRVEREVPLASTTTVGWGGQFENFERAKKRLAIVVPVAVAIVLGLLFAMFRRVAPALAVFATVPFALGGGMVGLLARGYALSLPAAVGFIALGGIAVLNGVVLTTEVQRRLAEGDPLERAVQRGATETVRAVLTTALVAALGFLPMALATTAGAEVQKPLATVVIVGIAWGTVVTLFVLPGLLRWALAPAASPIASPEPAE